MKTPLETETLNKPGMAYTILTNLTFWVLIAIAAGILLGHFDPQTGVAMKVVGDGFISIVKVFIGPIIFLTIILGIAGMGDLKKVGRIGIKSLIYFEIVTTFALAIGIAVAYLIEPGKIDRSGLEMQDATKYTGPAPEFDWVKFFMDNFTLQVLVVAITLGVLLNFYSKREKVVHVLYKCSNYVFKALKFVMYLAPVGAFGGMAYTVGKFGLHTLVPLGKLMITVYITMFLFIFLILGGILRYYKINILDFLKYIKAELLIVLGTSSSEAALPNLMEKLEKMGCSKS
ncbi:MAG: cation:dicarboxylase symporter family transporter, partial [Flavobacterium sp.]